MMIAAVVVTWRECDLAIEALNSLAAMDPAPNLTLCVAQELNDERLKQLYDRAPAGTSVLEVDRDLGFSAAANLGFRAAMDRGAEWVLLVSNDAVMDGDCLGRCLQEARAGERIAAVGPAVAFTDDPHRLWYGGGHLSHRFGYTRHRGLNRGAGTPPPTSDTEYIPGCCVLYSVDAWRAVGDFREDFFMYFEDADWADRARAAGWRLRYLGEVLCYHAVAASMHRRGSLGLSEETAYYLARNPLRFALDTPKPSLRLTRVLGLMTVWNAYNAWRVLESRRFRVGAAYVQGLSDALKKRMGPRPITPS